MWFLIVRVKILKILKLLFHFFEYFMMYYDILFYLLLLNNTVKEINVYEFNHLYLKTIVCIK